MRTRVKICGITNVEDARLAISAGVDALGFNMFRGSKRFVNLEEIREILMQLPPFVTRVGLFVNEGVERINEICAQANFDLLQFHGDESDEFCSQFRKPYIKAVRVKPGFDFQTEIARYPGSAGILLDAFVADQFGGTGKTINWRELSGSGVEITLAGGLQASNVNEAISVVRPYAVDVSSGVEVEAGRKDPVKVKDFMAAVAAADAIRVVR